LNNVFYKVSLNLSYLNVHEIYFFNGVYIYAATQFLEIVNTSATYKLIAGLVRLTPTISGKPICTLNLAFGTCAIRSNNVR
jgi:hypothetical protein